MSSIVAKRGHVYRIALAQDVIVRGIILSNDRLNDGRDEYIVAQIVASKEHEGTGGAVRLTSGDPAFGYIICRDLGMVHHDELKEDLGPVTLETIVALQRSLRNVLGL